jgi:hypothetical protein
VRIFYGYGQDEQGLGSGTADVGIWVSLCATGLGSASNSEWNENCNEKILGRSLSESKYYEDSLLLLYLMLFNGNFDL